jgi:formamidopyrimidine-DNA glycosylase
MPELPEVETICRSLGILILHKKISDISINRPNLRYPIPSQIKLLLCNKTFTKIFRRGKYILLETIVGTLIVHLGMSGKLLTLPQSEPSRKHEHVVFNFVDGLSLRFIDPRRFGAILWVDISDDVLAHPLLRKLGVEPLSKNFTANYLYKKMQGRNVPIKQLLMDAQIVVGVGNIYANEALFLSGINPQNCAKALSLASCQKLVMAIKQILRKAIKCGGTTIRDFVSSNGDLGYFVQQLQVYGRANQLCVKCGNRLNTLRLGQRSTFYCPHCQK